jgi:acetyl esterase/lipase
MKTDDLWHGKVSERIAYGDDPLQFGDLRIPSGRRPFPIIMLIHGGCWLSQYDLTLMDSIAEDLMLRGYATWNIEYRRTEDPGGGWPGTFLDAANGLKYIKTLCKRYAIDLEKIVVLGHSAGGHLALWLGAQYQLPSDSEIKLIGLPELKGIISLAGITDLKAYFAPAGCGSNVINLIGGTPDSFPDRYREGTPTSFLPLGIPQVLVQGEDDDIVPMDHVISYYDRARSCQDNIKLYMVPDASHQDVILPENITWLTVLKAINTLM